MIDFKEIELYGFTLYQGFGFLTVSTAIINILIYLVIIFIFLATRHRITKALRDKAILEALLTCTTVMMGFGALLETSSSWWQISYISRVGLLLISPFVLWNLVKAAYFVSHQEELTLALCKEIISDTINPVFKRIRLLIFRK